MAVAALTGARRLLNTHRATWARILAIYLGARVLTTVIMVFASELAPYSGRAGEHPGLVDFILAWDAQWYWLVAFSGYPSELPLGPDGAVGQNAWAFLPVYPWLAQGLAVLVGFGSWWVGAVLISLMSGFVACVLLWHLVRDHLDEDRSTWAVILFACGPLGAMFQVGYAEALAMALLLAGLLCVQRRYWWPLYLIIPVMGYTRPGVLAFALLLGLYLIGRWLRRHHDPLPRRDLVNVLILGPLGAVVGLSWQYVAAAVTGRPDAYLATELSWRADWTQAEDHFTPFRGWFQAAEIWSAVWHLPPWIAPVLVVVIIVGSLSALTMLPIHEKVGGLLPLWTVCYLLYLFAVFFPQSSVFRLLFPIAGLLSAVLALPRERWWRFGVLGLCLVGQWVWIYNMYAVGNTFWQIP